MRIKKYQSFLNENISSKELSQVNKRIKEYVSSISPNIHQPVYDEGKSKDEMRSFHVSAESDNSRFGKIIRVGLKLDFPVKFELVNDQIKNISFIQNLISIISECEGVDKSKVILNSFNFFDKSYNGQKNGHTGEVENVIPKFADILNFIFMNTGLKSLKQNKVNNFQTESIIFSFIVKS